MKILLAEDDAKLGAAVQSLLQYEGFGVDWAENGVEAVSLFEAAGEGGYDVVVLDWMMPELNGLDVCRILRRKYNFQGGIIFVTAKGEEDDCVRALNLGADDYVVKPFKIKELVARINALCRRKGRLYVGGVYEKAGVTINRERKIISIGSRELQLRKKEFALFEVMFANLGQVLPRAVIFDKVWSEALDTNMESLDSHIYSLRKKLKAVLPEITLKSLKNLGCVMEVHRDD